MTERFMPGDPVKWTYHWLIEDFTTYLPGPGENPARCVEASGSVVSLPTSTHAIVALHFKTKFGALMWVPLEWLERNGPPAEKTRPEVTADSEFYQSAPGLKEALDDASLIERLKAQIFDWEDAASPKVDAQITTRAQAFRRRWGQSMSAVGQKVVLEGDCEKSIESATEAIRQNLVETGARSFQRAALLATVRAVASDHMAKELHADIDKALTSDGKAPGSLLQAMEDPEAFAAVLLATINCLKLERAEIRGVVGDAFQRLESIKPSAARASEHNAIVQRLHVALWKLSQEFDVDHRVTETPLFEVLQEAVNWVHNRATKDPEWVDRATQLGVVPK